MRGSIIHAEQQGLQGTDSNRFAAGFCPEQSAKTRGIGYEAERSPTLRGGVIPAVVIKGSKNEPNS